MGVRVLCVVLVVVLGCGANAWETEYTSTGKEEGDECQRVDGEVWTCKKSSECEGLQEILRENGKLKTCSWVGRSPILCCPPRKDIVRLQTSRSEEKCAEYSRLQCNNHGPFLEQGTLLRRRRGVSGGRPIPEIPIDGNQDLELEYGDSRVKVGMRPFIVGGIEAKPRENPHMALIGYGNAGSISWQCGGSLISENFVLSAAHCVNTPYGLARWVRLGDLDIKSDTEEARPQQLEIVERLVHPGYRSPAYYNDLALLRLERQVVFDRYVRPACLHSDTSDPTGAGTAAGWGKNETHGPRSSALMKVDISFVPADECKTLVGTIDKYLANGLDTDTMVCAGELGKDTCQGDSGGPLILPSTPWSTSDCLAKLVGVTSFGPRICGMTSVPGVYVRVAHFLPWIESIVWP